MITRDDTFWAGFLGVEPALWQSPGITFSAHVGLQDYRGFWCFRRAQRLVVSAPAPWLPRLRDIAAANAPEQLMLADFWSRALAADFERAIGPAFQGCLEPAKFMPKHHAAVRAVGDADELAVEELRIACGTEWDVPSDAALWRHGWFEDGVLTALAGFRSWSDSAGDPCVSTSPNARSGGRGAAVTSAVVAAALANRKLVLYQTLESNAPAVRLALSLGFERYANHLAVRLRRDAPGA